MKIASWNVNGIRACHKKGFVKWLSRSACDIVMLQEVRAMVEQIPKEIIDYPGYDKCWFPAEVKKGYAGTAILSKETPRSVRYGMGRKEFDVEGRVVTAEFKNLFAVSAYFPNSQDKGKRIDYKIAFCRAIHKYIDKLRKKGKVVVLGGDFNIAHQPIDLARPEENTESPGYLPEERAWISEYLSSNWIDTFRYLHPKTVRYSWWSMRSGARARNVGWRIDYHAVHEKDKDRIIKADIQTKTMGSDHCPVTLVIDV